MKNKLGTPTLAEKSVKKEVGVLIKKSGQIMFFNFRKNKEKKVDANNNFNALKTQVDKCINLYEKNDIQALQHALYELYENFNKPGAGKSIIFFPEEEKLAECFCFMLKYDWMNDGDIREVWAENAFYCIMKYYEEKFGSQIPTCLSLQTDVQHIDYSCFALDFFLIVFNGCASLKTKMEDCLGTPSFSNFLIFSAKVIQPLEEKFHVLKGDDLEKYSRSILMEQTIKISLDYSESDTWKQMWKLYKSIEYTLKIM